LDFERSVGEMKEGRYARKPLLYIEQANINDPQASMQSSYRSGQKSKKQESAEQQHPRDEKKQQQTEKNQKNEKNIFREQLLGGKRPQQKVIKEKLKENQDKAIELETTEAKLDIEDEQREEVTDQEEKDNQQEDTTSLGENKPFNELDIRGKVNYFINKPTLMPDMKCEVRTANEVHYGVIDDLQEEMVQVRKKKQNNPELIPLSEIESIRILGF